MLNNTQLKQITDKYWLLYNGYHWNTLTSTLVSLGYKVVDDNQLEQIEQSLDIQHVDF